jgi:foldase protein PrsA
MLFSTCAGQPEGAFSMTAVLRIRRLLALAACCAGVVVLVAACGDSSNSSAQGNPNIKVPADAIAVVGAKPVLKSEFDALLQEYFDSTYKVNKQPVPKQGSAEYTQAVQKVVAYLIQKTELEQEAAKRGITVTKADVDGKIKQDILQFFKGKRALLLAAMQKQGVTMAEFRQTVAFSVLQSKLVAKLTVNDKVTEAEMQKFYAQNKATQFTKPAERLVKHILVKTKAKADQLYTQLQNGADFAKLAKKNSTDTGSAKQGGKLGLVAENGLVKPFAKVAFSIPTNTISKPVRSQFGWHIIEAYGPIHPAVVTSFAKAKAGIKTNLLSAKNSAKMSGFSTTMTKDFAKKIAYASGYAPPSSTSTPTSTSVIPGATGG